MKISKPYRILIVAVAIALGVSYFFFVHTTGSVPYHEKDCCCDEVDSLEVVIVNKDSSIKNLSEEINRLEDENQILGSQCALKEMKNED